MVVRRSRAQSYAGQSGRQAAAGKGLSMGGLVARRRGLAWDGAAVTSLLTATAGSLHWGAVESTQVGLTVSRDGDSTARAARSCAMSPSLFLGNFLCVPVVPVLSLGTTKTSPAPSSGHSHFRYL